MELNEDTKDEIRLLIQEEIKKAFDVGLNAALNYPVNLGDAVSTSETRQKEKELITKIGKAVKVGLEDLKTELEAKIIEKTDPARADVMRRLKSSF